MTKVHFYTKEICSLCEEAEALLYLFQEAFNLDIEVRDIYTNDTWLEKYHLRIPVIEIEIAQIDCETMSYDHLRQFLKKHATS